MKFPNFNENFDKKISRSHKNRKKSQYLKSLSWLKTSVESECASEARKQVVQKASKR
jgi:hypothetical protein